MTFAVQAGGGRIDGATALTGADGIATAGDWTLGPAESANQLTATVASLPPVSFTATGSFPIATLVDAPVSSGGGTLTYHKAGDPLDGLTLAILPGSYGTTGQWKIETRPLAATPPRPGLIPVIPAIVITTTQGRSDSLIQLTIPVHVAPDSVPVVYMEHPATGRLEALPTVGWTATSVTVASRHFRPDLMLPTPAASALRAGSTARATLSPQSIQLLTSMFNTTPATALLALSQGGVDTGFNPTTDMWEFGNFGSYVTPGGQSTGNSLTAMYYFLTRRAFNTPTPALGLFGRYAQWSYWAGNPLGYRTAAMAETDVNWPASVAAIKQIDAASIAHGANPDVGHFFALLGAMANSHQPQVLVGNGPPGTTGFTALVVYKVTASELWAADPSNPGTTVKIPYQNGNFGTVQLASSTGGATYATNRFRFVGGGALIALSQLDTRWAELESGTVTGTFPAYSLEYWDEDFGVWHAVPANNAFSLNSSDVKLRALCVPCQRHIAGSTPGLSALDVVSRAGAVMATDRTAGEVNFTMPVGENQVGVHILGGTQAGGSPTAWRHLDFRVLTITASHYYVSPDPATGVTDQPVTLTAKNLAPGTPGGLRYDWSFTHFGSTQTAQVTGDSVVQHTWPVSGNFTATVTVRDVASGLVVGRATGQVSIGQALPIWKFTKVQFVFLGTKAPDGLEVLSGYVTIDIGGVMDLIQANPSRGRLFYYSAPVTIGSTQLPRGVYVSAGFLSDADQTLKTASFDPLGRPTAGPYVDQYGDDLVVDGGSDLGLSTGSFEGKAATRTRDLTGFPGVGGKHTVTHWSVSAVKQGTKLTGTITYYQEQWGLIVSTCTPPASLNCQTGFQGTMKWVYTFEAVRLQ